MSSVLGVGGFVESSVLQFDTETLLLSSLNLKRTYKILNAKTRQIHLFSLSISILKDVYPIH